MQNIFLIPDDAVARNLIIVYNFSSQRSHYPANRVSFDLPSYLGKIEATLLAG